jgi:hypothetical protein
LLLGVPRLLPPLNRVFAWGRDHCGNRLSYSNIGDEQPTI